MPTTDQRFKVGCAQRHASRRQSQEIQSGQHEPRCRSQRQTSVAAAVAAGAIQSSRPISRRRSCRWNSSARTARAAPSKPRAAMAAKWAKANGRWRSCQCGTPSRRARFQQRPSDGSGSEAENVDLTAPTSVFGPQARQTTSPAKLNNRPEMNTNAGSRNQRASRPAAMLIDAIAPIDHHAPAGLSKMCIIDNATTAMPMMVIQPCTIAHRSATVGQRFGKYLAETRGNKPRKAQHQ